MPEEQEDWDKYAVKKTEAPTDDWDKYAVKKKDGGGLSGGTSSVLQSRLQESQDLLNGNVFRQSSPKPSASTQSSDFQFGEPAPQQGNQPIQAVKVTTNNDLPDIKEGIDRAVIERNKKFGVPENKADLNFGREEITKAVKNGDLVLTKDNHGKSVLKRGAGLLESFTNAVEDSHKRQLENTYLSNLPKEKAITYLNNKRQFPDIYNQETESAASGIGGKIGEFVGENAMMLAKGTAGALGGSAAAPATGGQSFGMFLNTVKDVAQGSYASVLENNFNRLKDQHPEMPDNEVYDKAHQSALLGEAIGIGTNAILSHSLPTPKATVSTDNIVKSLGHAVKTAPKVVGASIAGSVLNDIASNVQGAKVSGEELGKNALEAAKQMATMHFGLWALTEPARIPSYARPQVENVVASAPREEIKQFYNTLEENGSVPEGTTSKVIDKLEEFDNQKKVVEGMPISEEQKASITGKLLQRKKIEEENKKLKSYGGSFNSRVENNDKAIEGLDKEIDGIIKTGDVARFEKDTLTGEGLKDTKPHEELKKAEREGIVVPKEYGDIEVSEKGEGDDKQFKANAYYNKPEGGLIQRINIKGEDNTYKSKEEAQKAAQELLGKHYYENGMPETDKPISSEKYNTVKNEKNEIKFKTEKGNSITIDEKYDDAHPDNPNFIPIKIVSPEGEELGGFQLNDTKEGYQIDLAGIKAHRHRQGIGKDAYISLIENLDKPLISGKATTEHGMTEGAKALWESLKRDGYATFNEKEGRYYSNKKSEVENESKENKVPIHEETKSNTVTEINKIEQPTEAVETEPTKEGGRTVGVSHNSLTDLAKKIGLKEPERGERDTPEQMAERGRKLYNAGADMDKLEADFKKDKHPTGDDISVARAHLEHLTKVADAMGKKWGYKSKQYNETLSEVERWNKEVVKPMGTAASEPFTALQGERDLDTDSFTAVRSKVEDLTGKTTTPEQDKKIAQLAADNEKLKAKLDEAEKKLIEETNKHIEEADKPTTFKEKTKKAADSFRKLKVKEFTFKDENGNEVPIQKMGLSWNELVEIGAKTIEKTGEIADGIAAIIDKVKDTDFYKNLSNSQKGAFEKQLTDHYANEVEKRDASLEGLQKRFLNKTDNKFSIEEAKDLWEYAKKEYLDKGVNYRDMISSVGNDLGLSWRQVSEAITSKKLKPISDEMWKKQSDYKRNQNATKRWVEEQGASKNPAVKLFKGISDKIRGLAVFGHGGIFIGTHAGMTFFQPTTWNKTIPAFFRAWKFAYGNKANYERAMEELRNRDNYLLAQRAGLKNNPDRVNSEEFQKSQSFLGKLGGAGEHGFNAIKVLRQDLFDREWNNLSADEKAELDKDGVPMAAKRIAEIMNLATGATNLKVPEAINEITFAGGMEMARWGKLTRNPAKAAQIAFKAITKPDSVPLSERVFAKVWAKRVGQQLGTFATALAVNAAMQNMINPKNKVNILHPGEPDWLKFKVDGINIDPTSGMLGAVNFMKTLLDYTTKDQKELKGSVQDKSGEKMIGYVRGKLSPGVAILGDIFTHTDFSGNTLPWSSDKPKIGKHKLSTAEYLWQRAPLPVAEAVKVAYDKANETSTDPTILKNVMNGLLLGAISGSTGFRASEPKERPTSFTPEDYKKESLKFFKDKGLEMPNTSLTSEEITDNEQGTKKMISDYPKDIQNQYLIEHKNKLEEKIDEIYANGVVYIRRYDTSDGGKKNSISLKKQDNYEEVTLSSLSKVDLEKVLKIAQSGATEEIKKKIFKNKE